MKKQEYVKGQIVGNLVFIKELPERIQPNGKKKRKAIVKCNCGNEFESYLYNVISGITISCPECGKKRVSEKNFKHGLIDHKVYAIWADVKKRCYNKNYKAWLSYGGRGIKMFDKWIDNPEEFFNYVTSLPNYDLNKLGTKNLTLDRIDTNKGYFPDNLRWVNATIQNFNKDVQSNNKTGYKGISQRKYGTYQTQVRYKKVNNYIGTFKTLREAINKRNEFLESIGILNEYTKYETTN